MIREKEAEAEEEEAEEEEVEEEECVFTVLCAQWGIDARVSMVGEWVVSEESAWEQQTPVVSRTIGHAH